MLMLVCMGISFMTNKLVDTTLHALFVLIA